MLEAVSDIAGGTGAVVGVEGADGIFCDSLVTLLRAFLCLLYPNTPPQV